MQRGGNLKEILFDGKIKWYRSYYLDIVHGAVSATDFMINENNESAPFGAFNGVRKNLKKITKAKPQLIPLIDQMRTNEEGILKILMLYESM